MGLFDGIDAAAARHGACCTVALIREKLGPDDAVQFDVVLKNTSVTAAEIARVLRGAGHYVQSQTLARHRRGDCRCSA